ncbi:hypothetical protein [Enterobacillus tribolii]|uniref:Uncharacterized protein n=1 Tax=Enterobacillus tribolii TaxID=1487935 RepID=A0A370QVE9_9GAMM|nr:hypothetical protein [Enterobacillus tribolii]MBW7981049.1 hypothetical protein [Enterobacillus tribolii]RDK92893.1 hypothetical protein C8D90_103286 [Enterobacillus tribolii]
MKVLYIGSGLSALQAKTEDYSDHLIICLNNAWRIFEDKKFDIWIHPGDFPFENYPPRARFYLDITYTEYQRTAAEACKKLNWNVKFPEHHIGYTSFFQGLYWIMMDLKPTKIGLLGFDHDYNPQKTEKWIKAECPGIHNGFNKKSESTIKEWSDNFFQGYEPDFFYGHGTPDPMRQGLGEKHIREKMVLANGAAQELGIDLVNYSKRPSPYNVFRRESL